MYEVRKKFTGQLQNVWVKTRFSDKQVKNNGKNGIWSIYNDKSVYKRILKEIKLAEHTILLSSFLIADTELENLLVLKARQGVRIYILTSSDAQLKKMEKEDPTLFDQQTLEHHKNMLNSFVGNVLCRSAEHLHAKYILLDPVEEDRFNDNCTGYISTANFTSKALKENPEIIVEVSANTFPLQSKTILKQIYTFFLKGFWEEATVELLQKGIWSGIDPIFGKDVIKSDISLPSTSSSNQSLKETILNYIRRPADELFLSAYTFDMDHQTTKELLAVAPNIKITLLSRLRNANYETFYNLANAHKNLELFVQKGIHAKFIITRNVDQLRSVVFTANLSRLGLDTGYEIGIELNEDQCAVLLNILNTWIEKADYQLHPSFNSENIFNHINRTLILQEKLNTREIKVENERITRRNISIKRIRDVQSLMSITTEDDDEKNFIIGDTIYLNTVEQLMPLLDLTPNGLEESKEKVKINGEKYSVFIRKGSDNKYIVITREKELSNFHSAKESLGKYFLVKKVSSR